MAANLLFLSQRLPFPPIKGEKIRQWQILNYLARRYDVHLGCLIDDPADFQHIDTVRALCRDMHVAPIDRRIAKFTCARGLLSGEALSVSFFRDRGLRRWVRDVMVRVRPDLTFVISSNMAPYILGLPCTGQRIVDLVDVDSEKFRAYADTATFPMRQVYRREWHRVAALERRIALECDQSTFVSDAEAALFRTMVPKRANQIVSVSNGVDHRYFDPSIGYARVYEPGAAAFVFTGTMDYLPNVDAVTWFATDMLPLIRRSRPDARFFIVGSNPVEDVKCLSKFEGVTVTGAVPDVRPYIFHATASVAPLRVARGIQNKVLEAMAMGKPVIVTPSALEGIIAIPGRDVILADGAAAIAKAAIRLTGPEGRTTPEGEMMGQAARRAILDRYDWSACLSSLDALLRPSDSQETGQKDTPVHAGQERTPVLSGHAE